MEQLTKEDIQFLMEAIDSHKQHKILNQTMVGVFRAIFTGKDPVEREKFKKEDDLRIAQVKEESKIIAERAIQIQAKLLSIRDSLEVNSLTTQ